MAEAVVRVSYEGAWQPVAPVWSLGAEADEHGPAQAIFVCRRKFPKFSDAEISIDGLVILDGWVEQCEAMDEGDLYTVTVFGEQRSLDDDQFERNWLLSGFNRTTDGRDGAGVDQAYWARHGMRLAEKSLTLGLMPNTIWYAQQAAGVTFDFGPGGVGPRTVAIHQTKNDWVNPFNTALGMRLIGRCHTTRANHNPPSGDWADAFNLDITNLTGDRWYSGTFAANARRYLSVFNYADNTFDWPKDHAEYVMQFSEIRASTEPVGGGGTADSQNGIAITADQAVPAIVAAAPRLSVGVNTLSSTSIYGLSTDGFQTPRQMLQRIDLDQWRYRVNPGRRLDRGPFPTVPIFTIRREAQARLRAPETHNRVVVEYVDQQSDPQRHIASVSSPRQRTQVIRIDNQATAAEAMRVADAFLADQASRRFEGSVVVAPGQLLERPSGQPRHPSELLLAGGERVWVDDAEDHGRAVRISYSHDTETATVELTEPQDDLDRELSYLSSRPT